MFAQQRNHLLIGLALGATALAVSPATAQTPRKTTRGALRAQVNTALDLDRSDVQDLAITVIDTDSFSTTVMIDGQPHTLDMTKHSLRAPNFELRVQYEADGPLIPLDPPPVRTFRGTVRDMAGSEVRLTHRDGHLEGIVLLPDERAFGIQPLADLGLVATGNMHTVYDAADWLNSDGYECGVDALMEQFGFVNPAPDGERQAAGSNDEITEIGLDCDSDYYTDKGSDVDNALDAMETIINNVAGVYEVSPINLTYEITVAIVRTTSGSYTSSDAGTLLCQFRSEWNSLPESQIQRDVTHLFTGKNLVGTTIGVAWLSRVCNVGGFACGASGNMAYGLSQNISGTTSRTALTAHELGHNWSAPHCNSSANCRIMCSGLGGCDGLSPLTFAPAPESSIINYRNNAGCFTPLGPPQSLPFCEEFTAASIDTDRWSFVDGAVVTGTASNPPSPPFALQLNASGSGLYLDDEIRTNFVLMAGEFDVELTFYTQHQGVEAGEELVIEYLDILDRWIELDRLVSDGVDQNVFTFHTYQLPVPAGHNDFRLRFRAEVDGVNDNWYIDDIGLDCFCEAPCSDGNVCTTSDTCMDVQCVGTAVDCSGLNTDCVDASCDANGGEGNCDTLLATNEGGACDGGTGFCDDGACLSPANTARVFMAREGDQNSGADVGARALTMAAGSSTRIMVWMADNGMAGDQLNGYQILMPISTTPLPGSTGSVSYLNNAPGSPELGDSIRIDTTRDDWVFADEPAILDVFYTESDALQLFGALYTTIPGIGPDPSSMSTRYLGEFEVSASADALGDFELRFNQVTPPLTQFFDPIGFEFGVDQFQILVISVVEGGGCDNGTIAECADIDNNEIRDDNCVWYECAAGSCIGTDIVFADMGGQFGACPPDGAADGNDRFHALNCFANVDPSGGGTYNCEAFPPAAYNVDAGGQFGSCNPDGVCDGNDAFAALNAFGGVTTCSCPLDGGPAPTVVEPQVVNRAGFELSSQRASIRAGELIEVDVRLDRMLPDLRGYQLHIVATGGRSGHLELVDIAVPGDGVFASEWTAFNRATGQMVAGRDGNGVMVSAGSLATFTFRASKDAAGTFNVEVLPFDALNTQQRTFLFPTAPTDIIAIDRGKPLVVEVNSARRQLSRTR